MTHRGLRWWWIIGLTLLAGCSRVTSASVESCMQCHNATLSGNYSGPGIENPHPFAPADSLKCTTCHGGNGRGKDQLASHVPPPPQIGDEQNQINNNRAYFNRLTLAGIDKYADYQVGGKTYTALQYLQFVNPGDLRVVTQGNGCGQCHAPHAESVAGSLLATEAGIFAGSTYAIGLQNAVPASQGLFEDTAADLGFRAVVDPDYASGVPDLGEVVQLLEQPVFSAFGDTSPNAIHNNPLYSAAGLADDRNPDNSAITGSPLANLFHEQVSFTCGDCHLGSAGANNRYADFRSSGCAACHMPYSPSGRSGSSDPNIVQNEPLDPDDIDAPERAHARTHQIRNVAKTLPGGVSVQGIDDYTCVGCHQGSNRTVMQYWGIRLDQNADVHNGVQYPANPISYVRTHNDTRLFDPVIGNNTFNGRNGNQYLLVEDYDGDGRDDTPADVHYEAGLGCIDCHGSHDLHGGNVAAGERDIASRMEQSVSIRCESCHGTVAAYAPTTVGTTYDGMSADLAMDAEGLALRNVFRVSAGEYYLRSRLTGNVHYVPQIRDIVVDSAKVHPVTQQPIYSVKASYAMGRADGNPATGLGPQQVGGVTPGFSHGDNMDCASCHASWTNTCMGCHLSGEYNTGNNFSNITGERIVFRQRTADFTYQSPVYYQLGVGADNKITPFASNTKVFFQWEDQNNNLSQVFTFTDRNGGGSNPAVAFPSLSHNAFMAHSIRGKVEATKEGPRYCATCHLTNAGLATWGSQYNTFRTAMAAGNYGALDFNQLRTHFGQNPGNQLGSPFWPHMVAGLGTGLFLFDADGCPENPLDTNPNRVGCNGVAPASNYNPAFAALNLDRIVEGNGRSNGSSNHAMFAPGQAPNLRDGALDPNLAGPLGMTLIRRLTDPATGIVLDSWLDANGQPQGNASTFVGN